MALRIEVLTGETERLAEAVAKGGDIPALVAALQTKEAERLQLQERVAAARTPSGPVDIVEIRASLREAVREWRRTLTSHTEQARIMVQTLVDGRLVMQPQRDDDGEFYEFSGVGTLVPIISGIVPCKFSGRR